MQRDGIPCECRDPRNGHLSTCKYNLARRARLDEDGTAKPLTEIVAVMPESAKDKWGTVHAGQATHYLLRAFEVTYRYVTNDQGVHYLREARCHKVFANDGSAFRIVANCPTEEAARAALRLMQVGT